MTQLRRRTLIKLAGALPMLAGSAKAAPARLAVVLEPGNAVAASCARAMGSGTIAPGTDRKRRQS